MLVDEWVDTVWDVVSVRPKTLHDYKRLCKRHLMPVIGSMSLDEVDVVVLQRKLISLHHSLLFRLTKPSETHT
jgi:hypothetical protein